MRILVVDDDGYSRKLIGHVLEEGGSEVCFAKDGREAIDVWREQQPDLILMDLMMPVMDGYTGATHIKDEAGQSFVPIVFMTAMSEEKAMLRCLEVGDDFLPKPVNLVMLQAKMRAHARNLELNRQVLEQNQELAVFRARVTAEHEVTQQVMRVSLQNARPKVDGVQVSLTPSSHFSGDLIMLYEKRDGGLYALIGDFTGHGLAASIGAVPVAQSFQALVERNVSVAIMARELNNVLKRFLPTNMFCAMSLFEFDPARRVAEVWAGGLPDALVLDAAGRVKRRIESGHMPMGVLDQQEFETVCEKVVFADGDRLFAFTDGVIEASSADQSELFGEDRLVDFLADSKGDFIEPLIQCVKDFSQSESFEDDLSLLHVSCGRSRNEMNVSVAASPPPAGAAAETAQIDTRQPGFKLEFYWTPEQLRAEDPLFIVRQSLDLHEVVRPQKDVVLSVLSECFNNALDHGVLGLSSEIKHGPDGFADYYALRTQRLQALEEGFIQLTLSYDNSGTEPFLVLRVHDSGCGFPHEEISWGSEDESFGRGLPLIRDLCSDMRFEDGGATIHLQLPLSH